MTSIKFRALTHNEQKLFFEALGEHGKDFQNIQQYMSQKCAKLKTSEQAKSSLTTSDPQEKREQDKKEEDKKREQIRNFYNKLYAKLSLLIGRLDDRVEKVNQELYLLINYGEVWKKFGFKYNNKKTKKLLKELVYQGSTTVRFKNKNVRLRTPPCKALKKINRIGIDEDVKVVTSRELPKDVIVEFHPATNRDWLKVQSMSQNPRVRAKLSMQKRISHVLEFLENKWNIAPDKLKRTIDAWLKVPNSNSSDELATNLVSEANQPNQLQKAGSTTGSQINGGSLKYQPSTEVFARLRLKPSHQHELKEVNITRVVPDNHLDLSLQAYIARLEESGVTKVSGKESNAQSASNASHIDTESNIMKHDHCEYSHGALSTSSRLPISLTTPDSSILFEKSMTSDQPSIAQARKHLNMLQSLAGSFGGGESSRMACEDTQDRSLLLNAAPVESSKSLSQEVQESLVPCNSVVSIMPELFDENAAIDSTPAKITSDAIAVSQPNADSQNSKSLDFPHIPKNLTLGDWFKMANQESCGDNANDSFPVNQESIEKVCQDNEVEAQLDKGVKALDQKKIKVDINSGNSFRPQNHMIEIKKFAEGWTRQDQSSLTIGELYLAFKCPDKINLEYNFEQYTYLQTPTAVVEDGTIVANPVESDGSVRPTLTTATVVEDMPNNTLIFKLLTAASLSLAQIERHKQEQQHKLHDQPGVKFKRRKGPSNPNTIKYLRGDDAYHLNQCLVTATSGNQESEHNTHIINNRISQTNLSTGNNHNFLNGSGDKQVQGQTHAMTLHDIETTNQRVEEALKQLQPTRLGVFRRAR